MIFDFKLRIEGDDGHWRNDVHLLELISVVHCLPERRCLREIGVWWNGRPRLGLEGKGERTAGALDPWQYGRGSRGE